MKYQKLKISLTNTNKIEKSIRKCFLMMNIIINEQKMQQTLCFYTVFTEEVPSLPSSKMHPYIFTDGWLDCFHFSFPWTKGWRVENWSTGTLHFPPLLIRIFTLNFVFSVVEFFTLMWLPYKLLLGYASRSFFMQFFAVLIWSKKLMVLFSVLT